MQRAPRVILLIETSTSWGREIVAGIAAYAQKHGPWYLDFQPRGRYEPLHLPAAWKGDGIIARVTSRKLAEEIAGSGLPAVNVSWFSFGTLGIARCTADEGRVGRLAAEYLMARGHRQFAYCGPSPSNRPGYCDRLGETFLGILTTARRPCEVYRFGTMGVRPQQQAQLGRWLAGLPRPLGVLAWCDLIARELTEACRAAGLAVPGDVAILSAEYDELTNSMSSPPISTVDCRAEIVGGRAAALLDALMRGEAPPAAPVLVEPVGVVTRQSTDLLAVADPLIAAVLRFISEHVDRPIRVGHILEEIKLSRRALEQRFRDVLGSTLAREIRRVRLDRARQMLIDTHAPIGRIAKSCGFLHAEVLDRNFRRQYGLSPSEYRRQYWV